MQNLCFHNLHFAVCICRTCVLHCVLLRGYNRGEIQEKHPLTNVWMGFCDQLVLIADFWQKFSGLGKNLSEFLQVCKCCMCISLKTWRYLLSSKSRMQLGLRMHFQLAAALQLCTSTSTHTNTNTATNTINACQNNVAMFHFTNFLVILLLPSCLHALDYGRSIFDMLSNYSSSTLRIYTVSRFTLGFLWCTLKKLEFHINSFRVAWN